MSSTFVTKNGKTFIGYDDDVYKSVKKTIENEGYRKATKTELDSIMKKRGFEPQPKKKEEVLDEQTPIQ
jgi:hypothetical protein